MAKQGGLAGVVAGTSEICTVGQEGLGLHYRGYEIRDLAAKACFEEVAYLLIYGQLPSQVELEQYRQKMIKFRALPPALIALLEQIPSSTHPMDVLRTTCSFMGSLEPETQPGLQQQEIATRLIALYPGALLYWYHFHQGGQRISTQSEQSSLAGHFLQLLHQAPPDALTSQVIDTSLTLYAEHEFNASTFAARVTAATLSDFYSAICSAIGTLRGALHGGANEEALKLIQRYDTCEQAQEGIVQKLKDKDLIMGFGHRVYTVSDPRSDIIKELAQRLSAQGGNTTMQTVAEEIEGVMRAQKNLFPNLDFYSACAYHFCGVPMTLFTPIFVFARTAGWAAHIIEQRANNKLIRPMSEYTGPGPKAFVEIDQR